MRGELTRAVLFKGPDLTSLERCTLAKMARGWHIGGTVVASFDGQPAEVIYGIGCDDEWRTRSARIRLTVGTERRELHLGVNVPTLGPKKGHRQWTPIYDGKRLEHVGDLADTFDCFDVDLGVTPSTNTLPIRRLDLQVGESAEVTAVWVRFPALTVQPLTQRYTRLDERRYRYESATGFSAELEVDELGLVVRYGDVWERAG